MNTPARIVFLTVILPLAVVGFACDYNVTEKHFADRQAARTAGQEGWLPDFLPPSAHDIHLWTHQDSGGQRGTARFDRAEEAILGRLLATWTVSPISPPAVELEWWPATCRPKRAEGARMTGYVASSPQALAVRVDSQEGVICWWSTHV